MPERSVFFVLQILDRRTILSIKPTKCDLKILYKKGFIYHLKNMLFFLMINAYKKCKNKKFKKISQRDPSCGHLQLILRSKLSLKFSIKIFFLKLSGNSLLLLYLFFQKYIFSYFRVYFLKIFFYIHTGEIFMYIILKNQCCSNVVPDTASYIRG